MIKNFKPRLYQETIFATAVNKNTLVVLPTGMGKTQVFLMLAAQRLKQYPKSKIMLLGPTRPLIEQYYTVFKKYFEMPEEKMVIFTGMVSPGKRAKLFKEATLVFSTPQGLENDVISGRISLEDVSLLGFDECHRAVGDYSYCFLSKQYNKKAKYPRIIGLTASPGSDLEKITEVAKNLYIEDIEIRSDTDPDVRPYIQELQIKWVKVDLPEEFKTIKKYLEQCFRSKLSEIKKYGYAASIQMINYSKKDLLGMQASLQREVVTGNKSFDVLKSMSLCAEALKVQHALELLETQGITALYKYMTKLQSESATSKVKAVQNLVKDLNFRSALIKTRKLIEESVEHPKFEELIKIVKEEVNKNSKIKIMVFTQYRDTGSKIMEFFKENSITSRLFVGQAKRNETGLSQKEQIKMLEEFAGGRFNVLVSTSVGEEGLDIPQVDEVIFYEPIPSAIRTIQRRGRTGRLEKGKVIVLVARKTRDEGYKWSAHHKEKRMHRILSTLKSRLSYVFNDNSKSQASLSKFVSDNDKIKVFADTREKGSGVIRELVELGLTVDMQRLDTADYILSNRVGVELKTVQDFVDSIIDKRLLQQLKDLKKSFERPLVIVEGIEDIYSVRKVHPNAIRGMLATITVSYGIPLLYSKNPKETAGLLLAIARREQDEAGREFSPHSEKKPLTLKEQQEYIVSALPGVGATISKPLLKQFGSVKKVVNATEKELKDVELIGPKKAKAIKDVVEREYGE